MKKQKKLSAIQKRAAQPEALSRFSWPRLQRMVPLTFSHDPAISPSPKPHYRSAYRYQGHDALRDPAAWSTLSSFTISLALFDFSNLEPLLAFHLYQPSALGRPPFHPVSMYLLVLFRHTLRLSRRETLRRLTDPQTGKNLRHLLGFKDEFPSESGLCDVERRLTPALQQEINALQIDLLHQAGFLPPVEKHWLAFDGMLHEARSRMRCAQVNANCYQPAPRSCRAHEKGKRGCQCEEEACLHHCRYAPARDPDARLVVYTGNNKRGHLSPNASSEDQATPKRRLRFVYGYYSYSGQLLDNELATYWILPAAFGAATQADRLLFPQNFAYLRQRFPWLKLAAVLADAGAGYRNCLDPIWEAGALRMVDIVASASDRDPERQLLRGYDDQGYPFCPFGFKMHSNGHDYQRRLTKWRCAKGCLLKPAEERPPCDLLQDSFKHGYIISMGREHADGSVRLAREIPYGSDRWKELYHRRNSAESRNSILEKLGVKRLPVHTLPAGHTVILQADFIANQNTLIRLVREAIALQLTG